LKGKKLRKEELFINKARFLQYQGKEKYFKKNNKKALMCTKMYYICITQLSRERRKKQEQNKASEAADMGCGCVKM
jgi:hypothetical protein